MALEKVKVVGSTEVAENGCISVRTDTVIKDDGKEISRSVHRHTLAPTADVSGEDARVQAVAAAVWTDEVKAAYAAAVAAAAPAAEEAPAEESE